MDFNKILEELDYYYYKYGKSLIALLLVVVIAGFGIWAVNKKMNEGKPTNAVETIELLINDSAEVREVFSLLDKFQISGDDKYPVYQIDLYVKKPFLSKADYINTLNQYTELIKIVEEQEGRFPRAIRYRLYDRYILWEQDLEPKGIFEYRYPVSSIKEDDLKKGSDGTPYETFREGAWRVTTENKRKPRYENYGIEGEYRELRVVHGSDPLSDQEFEWYLKMNKYSHLGGTAPRVYTLWELGTKGSDYVSREFREFQKRLNNIGDEIDYYKNPESQILKKLVVTHPQLITVAGYNYVAKDNDDAMRYLLQEEPRIYSEPINEWLDEMAQKQVDQGGLDTVTVDEIQGYGVETTQTSGVVGPQLDNISGSDQHYNSQGQLIQTPETTVPYETIAPQQPQVHPSQTTVEQTQTNQEVVY